MKMEYNAIGNDSYNPAMKKSGLKGHFPMGGGGSVTTGLSMRAPCNSDPDSEGMGTQGLNQMPQPVKVKKVGQFTIC